MERLVVGKRERPVDGIFLEHYFRYRFAQKWVNGATVLDCACGTGYGAYILSRKCKEVVGVDRSTEALEMAAVHWASPNIRYVALNIDDLDALQKRFDVIVSFETIEHLGDPVGFIHRAYDRLNEHGCLIVSTPNKDVYRDGLEPNPFHVHEFSRLEFLDLLSSRFMRIDVFAQVAAARNGSPKSLLPSSSKFRTALVKMFVRNSLGYSLYLRRMKKRFSVVPEAAYENYQYLVAVCRK